MRGRPVGLALWLVLLAAVEAAGFLLVWRFFVRSVHGQWLDTAALTGNSIGHAHIVEVVNTILYTMSAVSLVIATAAVGFIALARRRIAVAVGAVLLIGGANATSQVLKTLIHRPELGVDMQRAAAGNSLPSGHATVAASVAVALILVLPSTVRGIAAVLGAAFAAAAGVATLSAGWHRPSDAVAALLVVGVWACVASLFVLAAQRSHGEVAYDRPNRWSVVLLLLAGLGLAAGGVLALSLTDQVNSVAAQELSRHRLMAAYAGGAMCIAGAASLVMAAVLVTAHRVVPRLVPPGAPDPEPEPALIDA